MTQDEAIKRASTFLQKIVHDDEDSLALIRVNEKENDVEFFIAALDQIRLSCEGLKQIISNQITKEQIEKNNELSLFL